jgi:signal transduction histidine kinase
VATHTYRIAVEAITNALRHADASTIEVVLREDPPSVTVADDGRGVPDDTRPDGHGLRTMRNRAETIGARLEWHHGERGRGTAVTLELPATTGREP